MNQDQVKGRTRQIKGVAKEIGGKLTDDKLLEKRQGAKNRRQDPDRLWRY